MRFSPPTEPVDLYQTVFDTDLLGRKPVSQRLSEIIDRIEDPLVIALDGPWGTGKSYFLQRWVGAHTLQNSGRAQTIYFDAFAHDYLSDPLVALVSAISARLDNDQPSALQQVKTAAAKFVKPLTRIGLAAATAGASTAFEAVGDAVLIAGKNEAENAVTDLWKDQSDRLAAMKQFREGLESLTVCPDSGVPIPIAFVVDELDRCRPDFALELLEIVKHFFAVPHVHFVLGVNLSSLENCVRVRYGTNINAGAYLQKFLSFTMNLPNYVDHYNRTTANSAFLKHAGKKMKIHNNFLDDIERQILLIQENRPISIRDIEKTLSSVALLPNACFERDFPASWRILLVSMAIARVVDNASFLKMRDSTMSGRDLRNFFAISDNVLNRMLPEGTRNRHYNHEKNTILRYWSIVCGECDWMSEEEQHEVVNALHGWGISEETATLPRKIAYDFLDGFSRA